MITIGYRPGMIGRIAELHGTYYHKHWAFGLYFEARVATELSIFLQRYDESKDRIWSLTVNNRIEGSIAIDGSEADSKGAHLRWFILSEAFQGKGYGRRLIEQAIAFCRQCHYRKIILHTFEGLDSARHLYESVGFRLVDQQSGDRKSVV